MKKKQLGGRPSKIGTIDKDLVLFLCSKGCTNVEIAKALKIATSTFSKYLAENEAFSDAVKAGRELADSEIEKSLYEAAKGYKCPETKVSFDKFGSASEHTVTKHYPPDTVAAMFWLANRQKYKWQHISKIEHSGPNGGAIQFKNLTDFLNSEESEQNNADSGAVSGENLE